MSAFLGGVGCEDPLTLKLSCDAAGLPTDRWWGKANKFTLPAGEEPGRGHVLLLKAKLDRLDTSSYLTLTFQGLDTARRIDLTQLTLLRYECVSPGSPDDPTATYLCELADLRHFFRMTPFATGYKAYNVSGPDGTAYQTDTLNAGSPWTWQEIVTELGGLSGVGALTLPFTPDGVPENLIYYRTNAWAALNDVLARCGCAFCFNTDGTYGVARLGSDEDSALRNLEAAPEYLGRVWDGYSGEPLRAWLPEKVLVHFMRRPQPTAAGGETPFYTVEVTLPATAGVLAGSKIELHDDLSAIGATGAPSNTSQLTSRAQERADDWFRKRRYASRPVLRAWRDIQPKAVTAVGRSVSEVVFDDRGGEIRTWAKAYPDGVLERWRPLADYPPWWPFETGGTSSWKQPVRAATTTALPSCTYNNGSSGVGATLTANANGALTAQDGVALTAGQDVLVKDQSPAYQNGIYTVTQLGDGSNPFVLTRRTDTDTAGDILGATVAVSEGTANADTVWLCTANVTITVGTTSLPWLKVGPSSAGTSVTSWKEPVRVATTTGGTLASSFENGDTVDGVVLATGDRILIKDQSSAADNGIYTVNASGAPTRATDADAGSELLGATVAVTEGTTNADSIWLCTANAAITVGVTSLPWVRVGPSPLTTKGDLYTRSSSADARLPVGTNGYVLTADSAQSLGIKWAPPFVYGGINLFSVSVTSNDTYFGGSAGQGVTLPSAGTYLLVIQARFYGTLSGTAPGVVQLQIKNITTGNPISANPVAHTFQSLGAPLACVTLVTIASLAGADEIGVEMRRVSGVTTWGSTMRLETEGWYLKVG